jgi:N utilization substance protein A
MDSGKTEFVQVKVAVDESMVKFRKEGEEAEGTNFPERDMPENDIPEDDGKIYFNEEHHMLLKDAKLIKRGVVAGEELIFPLETKEDYGRIAAQTAKQVIVQKIREAEKESVYQEFSTMLNNVVSGRVQRVEGGNVFVDLGRTTAILPREEQIPGERYRQGERIKAYLYAIEETPKGVNIRLSRSHPQFITKLFEMEAPEIANGVVEIKNIAREAGARSKIAVTSHEENIDPVGSCVGQRGVRVNTITNELGGEKIDIIEWSDKAEQFITNSLSPAKVAKVEIDEQNHQAQIDVDDDQFSLAIGKGGQNVRLAAKLTGYKLDIRSTSGENAKVDTEDDDFDDLEEEAEEEAKTETAEKPEEAK